MESNQVLTTKKQFTSVVRKLRFIDDHPTPPLFLISDDSSDESQSS